MLKGRMVHSMSITVSMAGKTLWSLVNTCQPERFRDECRTHYKALYKKNNVLLTSVSIEQLMDVIQNVRLTVIPPKQRAWRIPRLLVQPCAINARQATYCKNPESVMVSQNIVLYMLQYRPTLDICLIFRTQISYFEYWSIATSAGWRKKNRDHWSFWVKNVLRCSRPMLRPIIKIFLPLDRNLYKSIEGIRLTSAAKLLVAYSEPITLILLLLACNSRPVVSIDWLNFMDRFLVLTLRGQKPPTCNNFNQIFIFWGYGKRYWPLADVGQIRHQTADAPTMLTCQITSESVYCVTWQGKNAILGKFWHFRGWRT